MAQLPPNIPLTPDGKSLAITVDGAAWAGFAAELGAELADLLAAARTVELLGDRLFAALDGRGDVAGQLVAIGPDVRPAAAAGEATVTLQPSERGLRLLAAARAGHVELGRVEIELRHLVSPVGVATAEETESPGPSSASANDGPGDEGRA